MTQSQNDDITGRQVLSFKWYDPVQHAITGDEGTTPDIELRVLVDPAVPTIKGQIQHGLHLAVDEMLRALEAVQWHAPAAQTDQLTTDVTPARGIGEAH